MAEVIVLGSGTSNGIPMLGRTYPAEFLAEPKNHRTRSSILIRWSGGNILVDCSPEMRLQMVREAQTEVSAVIITHTHADHIMGMDDLRSLCILSGRPMPVYTLPEHIESIQRVFPYAFREFPPEIQVPRFDIAEMPDSLDIAGLQIKRLIVQHGAMRVIGLKVNRFVYLTDVSAIPPEIEHFLEDLEVLILDAVRYRPHPNHLNFEQAMAVVERFRPEKTYFTHLSDDYDHVPMEASLPSHVRLAYDGLRLMI